ncbi:MAG TPA: NAD-dependent epimerase/dehydratase family protein, partial [Rhodanobacteraceae bacterium]|nr:NAD-dependent epimerase/dehydratase family protein [Rhodanobacteraceae bacterium]
MPGDNLAHFARGMFMKVLVCGGAGYIGSHMVRHLVRGGHDVVVFD